MFNASHTTKVAGLALGLAAITASSTVLAGEDVRSAKVEIADLDLKGDAGIVALDRRLGRAVRLVCGPQRTATLRERNLKGVCMDLAWASIAPQRDVAIAYARRAATVAQNEREGSPAIRIQVALAD